MWQRRQKTNCYLNHRRVSEWVREGSRTRKQKWQSQHSKEVRKENTVDGRNDNCKNKKTKKKQTKEGEGLCVHLGSYQQTNGGLSSIQLSYQHQLTFKSEFPDSPQTSLKIERGLLTCNKGLWTPPPLPPRPLLTQSMRVSHIIHIIQRCHVQKSPEKKVSRIKASTQTFELLLFSFYHLHSVLSIKKKKLNDNTCVWGEEHEPAFSYC